MCLGRQTNKIMLEEQICMVITFFFKMHIYNRHTLRHETAWFSFICCHCSVGFNAFKLNFVLRPRSNHNSWLDAFLYVCYLYVCEYTCLGGQHMMCVYRWRTASWLKFQEFHLIFQNIFHFFVGRFWSLGSSKLLSEECSANQTSW